MKEGRERGKREMKDAREVREGNRDGDRETVRQTDRQGGNRQAGWSSRSLNISVSDTEIQQSHRFAHGSFMYDLSLDTLTQRYAESLSLKSFI